MHLKNAVKNLACQKYVATENILAISDIKLSDLLYFSMEIQIQKDKKSLHHLPSVQF